jgi:hypothetical protein
MRLNLRGPEVRAKRKEEGTETCVACVRKDGTMTDWQPTWSPDDTPGASFPRESPGAGRSGGRKPRRNPVGCRGKHAARMPCLPAFTSPLNPPVWTAPASPRRGSPRCLPSQVGKTTSTGRPPGGRSCPNLSSRRGPAGLVVSSPVGGNDSAVECSGAWQQERWRMDVWFGLVSFLVSHRRPPSPAPLLPYFDCVVSGPSALRALS